MNHAIQLEDRVSRSRSKHEGESSAEVCDRPGRTRVSSQRQLPTDHDYAVSTREYQLDQSSLIPASAAADLVLDRKRRPAHLDRSLHINFRVGDNPSRVIASDAACCDAGLTKRDRRGAGHSYAAAPSNSLRSGLRQAETGTPIYALPTILRFFLPDSPITFCRIAARS